MHIFTVCASIGRETFCKKKTFFSRVVAHFQEEVGGAGVLSGEDMVHVVVSGIGPTLAK